VRAVSTHQQGPTTPRPRSAALRGYVSGSYVFRPLPRSGGCSSVRDPAQERERLMHQCSLVSVELALEDLGEPGFTPGTRRLQ
jgi:hypothetical protein